MIEIRDVEHQTYQRSIDYYFTTEAIHKYRLDSLNLVSLTANLKFDSLINELNRLGFDTMESQPDSVMETIADGTTYVIEIRTRDGYRMVRCVEPNHFNDANSRKWNDILKFLSSSVGFQYEDKDE